MLFEHDLFPELLVQQVLTSGRKHVIVTYRTVLPIVVAVVGTALLAADDIVNNLQADARSYHVIEGFELLDEVV